MTMAAIRRPSIETLVTYTGSALSILLDVILVVAILGLFGVETTTFGALLAGIGIAIGAPEQLVFMRSRRRAERSASARRPRGSSGSVGGRVGGRSPRACHS